MVIHINKLYVHTAVVTHIVYAYTCTAVNRARMYMYPDKKIYWYLVYKPIQKAILCQYIYMTTSRFGNLTRLIHITLL